MVQLRSFLRSRNHFVEFLRSDYDFIETERSDHNDASVKYLENTDHDQVVSDEETKGEIRREIRGGIEKQHQCQFHLWFHYEYPVEQDILLMSKV